MTKLIATAAITLTTPFGVVAPASAVEVRFCWGDWCGTINADDPTTSGQRDRIPAPQPKDAPEEKAPKGEEEPADSRDECHPTQQRPTVA